jgi:hypothetical protein
LQLVNSIDAVCVAETPEVNQLTSVAALVRYSNQSAEWSTSRRVVSQAGIQARRRGWVGSHSHAELDTLLAIVAAAVRIVAFITGLCCSEFVNLICEGEHKAAQGAVGASSLRIGCVRKCACLMWVLHRLYKADIAVCRLLLTDPTGYR